MGCPLRATMEVDAGRRGARAAGLARPRTRPRPTGSAWSTAIKPHTDFKGTIESGLFKMMTIGLGKWKGAIQYHRANVTHGYETVITAVGREILSKVKHRVRGRHRRERLRRDGADRGLQRARISRRASAASSRARGSGWPGCRSRPIDVLIVEEMGKNISGSGMDTNIIGRPTNPHEPFPADPKILWIVALDLTDESYGNAIGIGNADFTTRRLVDKIDMKPTLINAITACEPGVAKVPATYETDREAVEAALSCIGLTPPERARIIRIKNTLVLGEIEVSEAFAADVARRSDLTILGEAAARLRRHRSARRALAGGPPRLSPPTPRRNGNLVAPMRALRSPAAGDREVLG